MTIFFRFVSSLAMCRAFHHKPRLLVCPKTSKPSPEEKKARGFCGFEQKNERDTEKITSIQQKL